MLFTASDSSKYIKRSYRISERALLTIRKGNIVHSNDDALVNAANERMLGGGGVDGAIHRAAGPELVKYCHEKVPELLPNVRCRTGDAVITPAFNLKTKYIIHTVGPIYHNDTISAPLLYSCYKRVLETANGNKIQTVAFPAVSTGVYGYPPKEAAQVSLKAISENIGNVQYVSFYLFDDHLVEAYVDVADRFLIQI
uniref:Macro domain-containing protein n=1 Tax=Polytomella parva TaxID=51329 RepID=A0A7S0UQ37_9CHLO|mmetsp:Transcript_12134/g.21745  ORF Transcript_12134/g.21745 Transcript_12134/m.21745 type:complete len:197 (+) Transcript_12134:171-761(+)|eukprot:CAMPEP_0175046182 /NCGR_PEP_ID=MMETSP0052_2-20121109/4880_1 /TAXON_ID=51329 ORGANISM="Polytomella parva, Strain SAG 63-3" /NCGR_SAMPLE_ID=MMETSP0052_2 /ASSEMBLY_ACC=CAM_ASM_000194 /LENGTH=196 /DNA_ID=CAMNT_0016309883 /DNA_START=38 /DNA_END=628 /DNA_ORIENTATION=+